MARVNGEIKTLEEIEEMYWNCKAPALFSFCGILEKIEIVDHNQYVVSQKLFKEFLAEHYKNLFYSEPD